MESIWYLLGIKPTVIYVHDCHLLLLLLNVRKHQRAKQMSSVKWGLRLFPPYNFLRLHT